MLLCKRARAALRCRPPQLRAHRKAPHAPRSSAPAPFPPCGPAARSTRPAQLALEPLARSGACSAREKAGRAAPSVAAAITSVDVGARVSPRVPQFCQEWGLEVSLVRYGLQNKDILRYRGVQNGSIADVVFRKHTEKTPWKFFFFFLSCNIYGFVKTPCYVYRYGCVCFAIPLLRAPSPCSAGWKAAT